MRTSCVRSVVFPNVIAFALTLMACSTAAPRSPETPADDGNRPQSVRSSEATPGAYGDDQGALEVGADLADGAGIGAGCTPNREDPRGACADGLFCLPLPGGYCASMCGDGVECGPGAVCIDSHRGGQGCAAQCQSDADCRVDEGYACDPVWSACLLPGLMPVAPKAPVCAPDERLAKRRFGEAVQISTGADGVTADLEVSAALDADGGLTAAYIARTRTSAPNPLGLSTIRADGTIERDRRLPDDQDIHFDPWMASDRKGRLYLAWLGFNGDERDMRIGLATSQDGRTWSAPIAVHDVTGDCPNNAPHCMDKPQIAIGPDANKPRRDAIYVVYSARGGQRMVRSIDGGRSFSSSVKVSESSYGDLRVDDRGGVHIVKSMVSPQSPKTFGDPEGRIEYIYSKDGERFSAPITVSRPGEGIPGMFVNPQVVPDRKRRTLYVLYPSGSADARWDLQLAVSTDWGRTWQHHRVNDDAPCANHMLPAAALDPKTGRVHVMWVENRGGIGQVAYSSCDANGCEANERISDEPFAAYSFVRHSSKWLGEYNALLFDEQRRVLHAVWAQPVDEDGVPRSRIFHATAELP
jgi:hypothetical protein